MGIDFFLPLFPTRVKKRKKVFGFSLLEMMVCNILGLLIITLFIQLYLILKNFEYESKNIAEHQHKLRFTVYLFTSVLSKAGLNYCSHNAEASDFQVIGKKTDKGDILTVFQCIKLEEKKIFAPVEYFIENNNLYFKNKVNNQQKRPLVYGITKMEIQYGVSCLEKEDVVCEYVNTPYVKNWKKVRSLFIELHSLSEKETKKWYIYVALPKKDFKYKKQNLKNLIR